MNAIISGDVILPELPAIEHIIIDPDMEEVGSGILELLAAIESSTLQIRDMDCVGSLNLRSVASAF